MMKLKLLAIDQSLNETGFFLFPSQEHGVIKPSTKHKIKRLECIRMQFRDLLKQHNPDIIVLEGYSFGSRGRATFSIGEIGGILKLDAIQGGRRLFIVPPTVWKKFICGKGNIKKEQVLMQVYKKYDREFSNNNICDAFCLGAFIRQYLLYEQGDRQFKKYELEVFKKYEEFLKK